MEYPFELTLKFKTKEDRGCFLAWYLSGGGDQDSNIYAEDWNIEGDNPYMCLEPQFECCVCGKDITTAERMSWSRCQECIKKEGLDKYV